MPGGWGCQERRSHPKRIWPTRGLKSSSRRLDKIYQPPATTTTTATRLCPATVGRSIAMGMSFFPSPRLLFVPVTLHDDLYNRITRVFDFFGGMKLNLHVRLIPTRPLRLYHLLSSQLNIANVHPATDSSKFHPPKRKHPPERRSSLHISHAPPIYPHPPPRKFLMNIWNRRNTLEITVQGL